jgi:peptidoglycan/xylan/chitin deacetylase (PgdA/CDA1 family)
MLKPDRKNMASSKETYTILDLSALRKKVACLTLDLEQDYGTLLQEPSYEGIEHIPDLVEFFNNRNIPLTCFVQGSLLKTHPNQVESLAALDVEFEIHAFSHLRAKESNHRSEIERSKQAYSNFFGKEPVGYRCPDGVIDEAGYEILAANGFKFDSSIFPSIRPGAFSNLRKPTKPFRINSLGTIEFPFTVFSHVIRVPIALSYIKLFGKPYLYLLKEFNLPGLVVFDFHLHDLFSLSSFEKIPLERFHLIERLIFKKIYQRDNEGLLVLSEFISILEEKGYNFQKLIDVYQVVAK